MGRKKRIVLLTLLFLCVFSIIFIVRFSGGGKNNEDITENAVFTQKFNNNLKACGWIPNWASIDGFESLKANLKDLNCISPVLYEANEDGSLNNISPNNIHEIIELAKNNGIKIYPTITLFDHEIFTKILQSDENYRRHIDKLIAVLNNDAYDGIDLDYESTKLSDKSKYDEFIIELSDKLHEKRKELIITVLSKWGDDITYPSLPETRKVQDWAFLSRYADFIRIMAYDFSFSKSKYPGPIAPLDWIESIIKYAKTKVPDEKLILGIHLYSYQWSQKGDTKFEANQMPFVFAYSFAENIYDETTTTASYDYKTVQGIINKYDGYSFEYSKEKVFVYQKPVGEGFENRVLVYIDKDGVLARKDLAARYNFYGVCYWRLGNEVDIIQEL